MTEPTVYYTTCVAGKQKYRLAIQADNEDTYNKMLREFLEENPGVLYESCIEMTPQEYKEYLRGY